MWKKILLLLIICLFSQTVFSQAKMIKKYHPFMNSFVLSGDFGLNLNYNDYENVGPGISSRISAEYFFETYSKHSIAPRISIEAGFLRGADSRRTIDEYRTKYISGGIGMVYAYQYDETFYPYLFAGCSIIFFDPLTQEWKEMPNNSAGKYIKTDVLYNGEIGLRILVANNLTMNISTGIKVSSSDRLDDVQAGKHDDLFFTTMIGLSYSLNGKTDEDKDGIPDDIDVCMNIYPGMEVDERGCPVDNDKDGVPDYLDKCPCSKEGVKVDKNGCILDTDNDGITDDLDNCPNTPKNVKVDEDGCPEDNDLDGVPDYIDQCPYTKLGVAVDHNGCPIDSDNDGVPDYNDKCDNTESGVKVDEDGCPIIEDEFVLSGKLSFGSGRAAMSPTALTELEKLIEVIKADPNSRWRIEGHTDSDGRAQDNYRLSFERANAVLELFISKGLDRSRFDIIRFGEDYPIADNSTPEGKAKNRRVVVKKIY